MKAQITWLKNVIYKFQLRKAAVYISVNQYFDYLVMLTILANCAFLAMTEPINEAEWVLSIREKSCGVTDKHSHLLSISLSLCWLSLKAQTSHGADLASLSSREFVISDNIFWVAFKFPTIGRDYLICKSERNLSSNFRFNYAISSSLSSIWDKARC